MFYDTRYDRPDPKPPTPSGKPRDPTEVYLVIVGECEKDAKPMLFSLDGKKLHGLDSIHTLQGGKGMLSLKGKPPVEVNILMMNQGLPTEELFILKEMIQEPTELDAICHFSNMLGDGNGRREQD
jgi:hypothetical protein